MCILKFFKKFYVVYIAIIIVSLVFIAPFIAYTFKRNYAIGNMIHIIVALISCVLIIFLLYKFKKKSNRFYKFINTKHGFNVVITIFSIVLLLLEIFICTGAWFIVGWDTRNVIFPDMQMDSDYMSMYPNQLFLAGLFRSIYEFLQNININNFDTYYFVLVIISCLCVFLSVILITYISKKLTSNLCAFSTFLLASVFLGLSPWIMVPYSDNFSMLITCLCLFLYVCIKKKYIKWPLILFFSLIGYAIKPTAIFVLLSILFVELLLFISKLIKDKKIHFNKKKILTTISSIVLIVICLFCSVKYCQWVKDYGVKINPEDSFSATHFLMMGINLENQGAWNIDDVNFSRSCMDTNEREQANIKEWLVRLKTNKISTTASILFCKTLTNYGDGAFCWEAEKPWCIENKGTNPVVWSLYGIDPYYQHNDNNNYFAYVWQWMWLLILIGCFLIYYNKKFSKNESVIILSLLAISAFLMICEPDPRYIMLYTPYMIILSTWGYMSFCSIHGAKLIKIKKKIISKN